MHVVGFLSPFNFGGYPAASLPCRLRTDAGLPTALQIVAPRHSDHLVLRVCEELAARLGSLPTPSPRFAEAAAKL